jgi:hypothetical protein
MFTQHQLDHFTGTENYHKWSALFRRHVLTDGAKFVADHGAKDEKGTAYWLFDAIASYHNKVVKHKDQRLQDLQIWILRVTERTAVLTCWADTGKGERAKIRQEIEFADFPEGEYKFYVQPGYVGGQLVWVIMTPNEY